MHTDRGRLAQPFAHKADERGRQRALDYLGYALDQGEGVILVTGEDAAALAAELAAAMDPTRADVVGIVAADDDGLVSVAHGLGLAIDGLTVERRLEAIEERLRQAARIGKHTLLIVEEAHRLPDFALEALRILSDLQDGGRALIQILLAGRVELRDRLLRRELLALRARIIAHHHADAPPPVGRPRLTLVPQPETAREAALERRLKAVRQQLEEQNEQLTRMLDLLHQWAEREPDFARQLPTVSGRSSSYSAWMK